MMTSLFWPGSALPLSVAGPRATARAAWPSSSLPEAEIALHHSGVGETEAQPKVVAAGPIIIIVLLLLFIICYYYYCYYYCCYYYYYYCPKPFRSLSLQGQRLPWPWVLEGTEHCSSLLGPKRISKPRRIVLRPFFLKDPSYPVRPETELKLN